MTNTTPNINFSFYKVSRCLPLVASVVPHLGIQEHF